MQKYNEKTLATVRELRLIDDALFRLIGARKEACQEILRTLLSDENLVVLKTTPQEIMTSLHREIILDVLCELGDGTLVNIEVQKGNQNDDVKRCRFHLSAITANKTQKGISFQDVPDVIIVYITEYDALGNGQAVTCSQMCQQLGNTYVPINDGAKVYYANTVIKEDTDKSELLTLLVQNEAFDDKRFPNLSEAIQYFKNEEKGVSEVCNIVEEYAKEYAEEHTKAMNINFAIYMLKDGKSTAEIIEVTHLTKDEIDNLRSKI